MTGIRRRRGWEIPEREATPEEVFLNRRRFLRSAGLAGLGLAAGCGSDRIIAPVEPEPEGETALPTLQEPAAPEGSNPLYPAELNPEFGTLDRPLTEEEVAGRYNNFYEFTQSKQVHLFVDDFETRPWTVELAPTLQDNRQNLIFEAACHEGNYALTTMLAGARLEEAEAETEAAAGRDGGR